MATSTEEKAILDRLDDARAMVTPIANDSELRGRLTTSEVHAVMTALAAVVHARQKIAERLNRL